MEYCVTREDYVNEFRKAAGKGDFDHSPDEIQMIFDTIFEEFMEFYEAGSEYSEAEEGDEPTRAQLCKEWADLQYVVSQAALYFKIPANSAFHRVHESNMTKVIDGKLIFREDGKVLKPDTYSPPDMRGL